MILIEYCNKLFKQKMNQLIYEYNFTNISNMK